MRYQLLLQSERERLPGLITTTNRVAGTAAMQIFSPLIATISKVVYQVWRNLIGRRSINKLSNLDFQVDERSEFLSNGTTLM